MIKVVVKLRVVKTSVYEINEFCKFFGSFLFRNNISQMQINLCVAAFVPLEVINENVRTFCAMYSIILAFLWFFGLVPKFSKNTIPKIVELHPTV